MQKQEVINEVVDMIKDFDCRSRFLQHDSRMNQWKEIGEAGLKLMVVRSLYDE